MDELIRMYQAGAITGYQLMIDSLHKINPQCPGIVLADLPAEIHAKMIDYAARYDPRRIDPNNRIVPAPDQVQSAAAWIREHPKQSIPTILGQA